jgi:hypothetical protein
MVEVRTTDDSGGHQEHNGGVRGRRRLPEMRRSDFEKIKPKNFRKIEERITDAAVERWIDKERRIDVIIEQENEKTVT